MIVAYDLKKTSTPAKTVELVFVELLIDRLKQEPDFLSELHTKAKANDIYSQVGYYKRLKEQFDELLKKYTINKTSDLIKELDDKILLTGQYSITIS